MSPEGPQDSPEGNPPTRKSAVEPLPPGSNAEDVVDEIDERIRESWKHMDSEDDTEMRNDKSPHDDDHPPEGSDVAVHHDDSDDSDDSEDSGKEEPSEPTA